MRPFETSPRGELHRITRLLVLVHTGRQNAWRRYRQAVRELSQFSDNELSDIGICRCDIEDIVRRPAAGKAAA
jgi:uncharacterized protein YjiS (DUF1127 family)